LENGQLENGQLENRHLAKDIWKMKNIQHGLVQRGIVRHMVNSKIAFKNKYYGRIS